MSYFLIPRPILFPKTDHIDLAFFYNIDNKRKNNVVILIRNFNLKLLFFLFINTHK